MNTTCIIPRSAIEERYDRAREDFNYQYDNSPYKLKCKEFYLGGGVENYEVASQILSMNEEEIAKSYLEDCDPKDWQSMRRYREDLMCDYFTPHSGRGYIDTEYTVTVFDEYGNEEFEFNGKFQI